ncbi:MAG: Gldg family protein [Planctomycetes bacterium]|nr:Gldg family protein [Planctomycetota bacterium]MCC7169993.1 Gldg family protein [Planctomycetota bacterium]
MTSTPKQRRMQFAISVALVTANLFLLNWIALGNYGRVDLTRDGVYTLHAATRKLLGNLDDLVTAKVYLSEKQFLDNAGWSLLPRQVKDKIDEFVAQANGKLQVEYRDPSDDKDIEREAQQAGIQQIPLGSSDSSSMTVFQPFCGVTLQYAGKEEVIPVAEPPRLEYDLAMAITKLTRTETITIGFNVVNQLPEGLPPEMLAQMRDQFPRDLHDIDNDYRSLVTELRRQFVVEKVPLTTAVPEHVNLLVVANTKGMNDVHRFHLDQYVMRGGKVVFLTEGVDPPQGQMPVLTAQDASNDEFFKHYGFGVKKNLVFDAQCPTDRYGRRIFYVPEIQPRYFDPDSALVANLGRFMLMFASGIELMPPPGVEPIVLCRTSPGAWEQTGFFDITPDNVLQQRKDMKADDLKQFDVVGVLKGRFTSYFANRPLPNDLTGASTGPSAADLGMSEDDVEDLEGGDEDESDDIVDDGATVPDQPAGGEHPTDAPVQDPAQKPATDPVTDPTKKSDGPSEQDVPGGGIADAAQDPPPVPAPAPEGATPAAPQVPENPDPNVATAPPEGAGTQQAVFVVKDSPETTIVVIGSSMMLTNNLIEAGAGNLEFFWSLVERLTTGGELSEIRNKLIDVPAVRADYTPGEKNAFKYVGMLGVPVIVLAIGILVYVVSKAKSGRAS